MKQTKYYLLLNLFLGLSSFVTAQNLTAGKIFVEFDENANIDFTAGSKTGSIGLQNNSNQGFYIITDEEYRFTVNQNGNVGIGLSNPDDLADGKLEIDGALSDAKVKFGGAGGDVHHLSSQRDFVFNATGSSNNAFSFRKTEYNDLLNFTDLLTIKATGRVGINTTGPTETLSVNGSAGKPGGGSWSTFSDARLKKDVQDFEDGLEEVLQIRPVRYHYNGKADLPTDEEYIGVIAQEIKEVAPYTVKLLKYGDDEKATTEYLSYDGTAVTYMLVNAIQDQQAIIEAKEERIAAIEQELTELKKLVQQVLSTENSTIHQSSTTLDQPAILKQNQPNPFTEATVIQYDLPKSIASSQLQITDQQGKTIKVIPIKGIGAGQVELKSGTLAAGTYFYSLIADGKVVDTKQMILTK